MAVEDAPLLDLWMEEQESERDPPAFWGSYMPFAGVRYFTILSEENIADGKDRIAAIGWRLPKSVVGGEAKPSHRDPVAV